MKALNEKRIKLRSLWRMGLVVLSVFALAFAACADTSGGGEGPGPGGVGVAPPKIVPVSFVIQKYPTDLSGAVHEGEIINKVGWHLMVNYSDGTQKLSTDPNKVIISPSIYDARVGTQPGGTAGGEVYKDGFYPNGYELTFSDNGRSVTGYFKVDNVRRILDIDIGGVMKTRDYVIDDIPDLTGLQIWGVYSHTVNPPSTLQIPSKDAPEGWMEQKDYYRNPIPFTVNNPDYSWAWVYNASKDRHPGDFIDDRPGILLSVGSYGFIKSKIVGQGAPTAFDNVILRGKREPIDHLYQVLEIGWNKEPTYPDIFYDDPRYISAVANEAELQERMTFWTINAFKDAELKVTYTGGSPATRNYTVNELLTRNHAVAHTLDNYGYGGTWANLELFPISWDNLRIDVTKDSKTEGLPNTQDFNWRDYEDGKDTYVDGAENQIGVKNGDGGWAQWAQLRNGRSRIMFYWREASIPTVVQIYNRPRVMEISRRDGQASTVPVILSGADYVYRTPEGMQDYLGQLKVSVTYEKQGTTERKARSDVAADIAAGSCRGTYTTTIPGYKSVTVPTLYSDTIFNLMDTNGDLKWATDIQSIDANAEVKKEDAAALSSLTPDNSNSAKPVRGTVYYRGWAGNPESSTVVSNKTINVAPRGYVYTADDV